MEIKTKSGDTGKDIVFNLKDYTMALRCEFVDAYVAAEVSDPQKLSLWVACIMIITDITEEELLKLTDLDIIKVAVECLLEVNNKKKVKK